MFVFFFFRGIFFEVGPEDLGIIIGLAALLFSFFSSFSRSEYLRVLRVCSQQLLAGEILAIMTVLQLVPVKESFRT